MMSELKDELTSCAHTLGIRLLRTCSADMWDRVPIQDPEYRPRNILPWAENAVVMGIPLFIPMVHSAPSMVYQELYNTTNRILDDAAYRITLLLDDAGFKAAYMPRYGYYGIDALLGNHEAAFSHVLAGYYSGMGTIGDCHNLITKEYGPRVRIVTVLTDAPLEPDPMCPEDLCIHCGKCLRECPSHAFTDTGDGQYSMDFDACTRYHMKLKDERHWPCGTCVKVCPVGDDVRKYRGTVPMTNSGREHCGRKGS